MRPLRARARWAAAALALVLVAPFPRALRAQESAEPAASYISPLERRITIRLSSVPLRDALDRVAVAARLRLSYAAELLPLDRPVGYVGQAVRVADVLEALLAGVPVRAVSAGAEQVVLAPAPVRATIARSRAAAAVPLDRVIVTGSAAGQSERGLTVALTVVDGRAADRADHHSLAGALDGNVPGVWLWAQSPASLVARYGSIRGASSFGATYPKVYVDGIEVANPLLVTQFDASALERVEIIRGPQGAALYGADAISGVVQFVTRQETPRQGGPQLRWRSSTGVAATQYAPSGAFAQEHALSLSGGRLERSGQMQLAMTSLGELYPGASQRTVRANGGARWITARSTVTATARLLAERIGAAVNPLLTDSALALGDSASSDRGFTASPQTVTQYTLGGTARFAPDERWTHTVVAGVDGYALDNVANETTPFPSVSDSLLRAARGRADRYSLRASSVARTEPAAGLRATWTFAAEHSALRQATVLDARLGGRGPSARTVTSVEWMTTSGLVAQTDLAMRDAFFTTVGVRLDRSDSYLSPPRYTALPLLGVASVHRVGKATVKFRAAYGRGIRAPRNASRLAVQRGPRALASLAGLAPEEQSGTEVGADLYVGRALAVQITRFDQVASGLIQEVVIRDPRTTDPRRLTFEYQNVGAITNRGWEAAGTVRVGPLAFTTALAAVESRVRRVATGYSGDLLAGDRVLGVPAVTVSAGLSWTASRWSATVGASRANDWVEYDRIELAKAYANFDRRLVPLVGADLRGYWRDYAGVTRLRAGFTRAFGEHLTFVLTGENLLDEQRGEPDNITIVPGRTLVTGVRTSFR